MEPQVWKIGKYLRLSNEDRDARGHLKNESDSIGGQRGLIEAFIRQTPDFANAVAIEFCDDGYTGTNMDRPNFQRMMELARRGELNCIIVKDLSRFGRNYLEVGRYIEKVLPFLRIRFISINDVFDSADQKRGTLDMSFKNLLNDLYSKDVSGKVKSGKRATALQGKYQNPCAPFGYIKSKMRKSMLAVDPDAAKVVRHIFELYLQNQSTVKTARTLNDNHIPTVSAYRKQKGEKVWWRYTGQENYWTAAGVRKILTDERYIGSVVYGRGVAKGLATHRTVKAPVENVIVIPNQHEAIISLRDFVKVQNLIKSKSHFHKSGRPLSGKIKCGICGHAMPLRPAKQPYFTCGTKWYTSNYHCPEMQYSQEVLYKMLLTVLKRQIQAVTQLDRIMKAKEEKWEDRAKKYEGRIDELEAAFVRSKTMLRENFERYTKGDLSETDFVMIQSNEKQKQAEIKQEALRLKDKICGYNQEKNNRQSLIAKAQFSVDEEITTEMLDNFISEVQLYPDQTVHIIWSFQEDDGKVFETQSQDNQEKAISYFI